jgi:hypothetical protein
MSVSIIIFDNTMSVSTNLMWNQRPHKTDDAGNEEGRAKFILSSLQYLY